MNMIWAAVGLAVIAWLLVEALRQRRNKQRAEEQARRNEVTQAFFLDRLDALVKLLQDDGLPVDEVERRAEGILGEMQALDEHGRLVPLIEDNRRLVAEHCAGRRAARR